MRITKRIIISVLVIGITGCLALPLIFIGPATLRLMDPELLAGTPFGILELSKPPPTVAFRQAAGGPLQYTEKFIPGAAGDPPVRIIIAEPKNAAPGRPALLDMHGGGFQHGSPEFSLATLVDNLVLKLGVTVVSVDYRLAPGTRYPGSLRDNYAALKWLHENAGALGVDPQRLALIGFSAGGGHAAALALLARDQGEVPLKFQALLSPMLDDRTGSVIDPGESLGRFIWTREDNRQGWTALLGMPAGREDVPAGAVPMRATDLSRLPPAFISVGSLDLFLTESVGFADKLRAAGVPVESHVFAGGFHGFEFIVPSAKISQGSRSALESYISRSFGLARANP